MKKVNKGISRRAFLKGATAFSMTMFTCGCGSLTSLSPQENVVEQQTTDEHLGIPIIGGNEEERDNVKNILNYLYTMPDNLASIGIKYDTPRKLIEAFAQKPDASILIDNDLSRKTKGKAAFSRDLDTNETTLNIDGDDTLQYELTSAAIAVFHETYHSAQDDKGLVYIQEPGYSEKSIRRLAYEIEISTATEDTVFYAMALINNEIIKQKNDNDQSSKKLSVKQTTKAAMKELRNSAFHREDYSILGRRYTPAKRALTQIANNGEAAANNLDAKYAVYDCIRNNRYDDVPNVFVTKYERQSNKLAKIYEEKIGKFKPSEVTVSASEVTKKITEMYNVGSKGNLFDSNKPNREPPTFKEKSEGLLDIILQKKTFFK